MNAVMQARRAEVGHFTESRFEAAVREWLRKITVTDVLDVLSDAEDELAAAIEKGDAEQIGRLVLAVRKNYAEHLVNHEHFSGRLKLPEASEVAAKVLAA